MDSETRAITNRVTKQIVTIFSNCRGVECRADMPGNATVGMF